MLGFLPISDANISCSCGDSPVMRNAAPRSPASRLQACDADAFATPTAWDRQAAVRAGDRQAPSWRWKPAVGVGVARFGAPVPGPARDEYRIDTFTPLQLADRDPWQRRAATPFALARDDKVEIEFANETHAVGAGCVIDTGERFVEQHQAWRQRKVAVAVEAGDCGKERYGQAQRPLTARGGTG